MSHRPARRASASPLFTPHGTDRASRKAARRQLAEATAKARAQASAHQTERASAAHEMPAALYPPSGRPGPASARHNRLKLPAHRMTTAVVAKAYPFLAEGGLGAEGIYIGRDVHAEASFVFDPFALYGKVEDSPTRTSARRGDRPGQERPRQELRAAFGGLRIPRLRPV